MVKVHVAVVEERKITPSARVLAAVASIALGACGPIVGTPDGGTGGGGGGGISSCGQGTVQVNNVCEPASGSGSGSGSTPGTSGLTILNGASAAAASTYWSDGTRANGYGVIAFYADGTGTYATSAGLACPGACLPPLVQCGGADASTSAYEGSCTSTSNDDNNCGACGNTCTMAQTCQSGACVAVACSASCTVQNHACVCPSTGGDMGPTLGGNGQPGVAVVSFTWSQVGTGSLLLTASGINGCSSASCASAAAATLPLSNLTQITGGVSDANFSAVVNGGATAKFTLVSGAICKSG